MGSVDYIFLQQNRIENKTPLEQKKFLRKFLLTKRLEQFKLFGDTKRWGEKQFFNTLTKLNISYPEELQNEFHVMCFFPIQGELNFIPFAKSNWLMPKVKDEELCWFEYGDGKHNYSFGKWNIPEKNEVFHLENIPLNKQLLCSVPGLAGDTKCNRLGYGKGFYDKFLSKNKNIISILCLPSKEFYFDDLPSDVHDVRVNLVIY